MTDPKESSEMRCARHMFLILRGHYPLDQDVYNPDDIAARYGVRPDTVYRAVRAGDPLYPVAYRKGVGPKAWLFFSREAVEKCDRDRLAFYRTTPSWHAKYMANPTPAPPRRAAKVVIAEVGKGRKA